MPDDELEDEPLDNVDNDEPLEHDEPLKADELHHEEPEHAAQSCNLVMAKLAEARPQHRNSSA